MVSIFRDNSAANVFWLIALSLLLHIHFFLDPAQVAPEAGTGFISDMLSAYIADLPSLAIAVIYHIIILVQAIRLNYILNEVRMFNRPAFTAALAYVLFTALFPDWNYLAPALVTNSFLIWLIFRFVKLYNSPTPRSLIYNIGLITGVAIAGYYPCFPLVMLVYFALATLRPFHANEWFILLIGIITPFYFMAAWFFVDDRIEVMLRYIPGWGPHLLRFENITPAIISYSAIFIAVVAGIFVWQSNSGRMLIQARKTWGVLLVMLILFIPLVFLTKGVTTLVLLLALVPAAAFAANFFLYPRSIVIPAIIFWLGVAMVFYNNLYMGKK